MLIYEDEDYFESLEDIDIKEISLSIDYIVSFLGKRKEGLIGMPEIKEKLEEEYEITIEILKLLQNFLINVN